MKKILLIEDDLFLKQLYTDVLTQEGYNVVSIEDGNVALKEIEKNTWDLILLDIMLPGLDGFTILDTLIKEKKRPSCPIVFMTNMDGNEQDIKKLSKANDYWIKSNMSPPDFIEKVNNLFLP